MNAQLDAAAALPLRTAWFAPLLAVTLLCGGCSAVKETVADIREAVRGMRGTAPAPRPVVPAEQSAGPATQSASSSPSSSARGPMPRRALNVRSACTSRDETGYAESIRLQVSGGQVSELEAKVEVPRHGSCNFKLSDFRQTKTTPIVELLARTGTQCAVRMWEQGSRLTVAFTDCHEMCARGAFEYVWPVELNAADGTCL